jgi:hypothetical protein
VARSFDGVENWDEHYRAIGRVDLARAELCRETGDMDFDVFICHASEDKDYVARPLTAALSARGIAVWLDERELLIGDSLSQRLSEGLTSSRFGVVVLSPSFFAKKWPQWELDGLTMREINGREVVILPVWHRVGVSEVEMFSPPLAAKVAVPTSAGIEEVAEQIARRCRDEPTPLTATSHPHPKRRPPLDYQLSALRQVLDHYRRFGITVFTPPELETDLNSTPQLRDDTHPFFEPLWWSSVGEGFAALLETGEIRRAGPPNVYEVVGTHAPEPGWET